MAMALQPSRKVGRPKRRGGQFTSAIERWKRRPRTLVRTESFIRVDAVMESLRWFRRQWRLWGPGSGVGRRASDPGLHQHDHGTDAGGSGRQRDSTCDGGPPAATREA